jgi:hypothetical protein
LKISPSQDTPKGKMANSVWQNCRLLLFLPMNEKKPSQAEGVTPDTEQVEQVPVETPPETQAVQTEEEKRKALRTPPSKKRGHSITIAPSSPKNPNLDVFDTPPTRL